ncbi:zinc finger MYM-type protein 5-like [Setaria italica]|uniref:zinc finger MYM-type protein 5-like n=1 Tax=Setaria italica TaxID=4555 RepID=UPI000BE60257|nr:zinc finger MYM-type protein 5-like [Setaria italica]
MSFRVRKYDSGCEKHKKKKRLALAAQAQKGALERFVVTENQTSTENQTQEDNDGNRGGNTNNVEAHTLELGSPVIDPNNVEAHTPENQTQENANVGDATLDRSPNIESENDLRVPFQPNIFDPRYWDGFDQKMIDTLIQKGPKRELSIQKGPNDRLFRRFSTSLYTRVLSNGEKSDREWLVYSKEFDRVFCFCYKLLRKGHLRSQLANEGFNDWSHVNIRLKEHETSADHITSMASWYNMRLRFNEN